MLSKAFWSYTRSRVLSSTSPTATTSSESAFIAPSTLPEPSAPPQQAYPNYVDDNARGSRWNVTFALDSLLNDIPTLPLALAGPFTQVIDVVSGTVDAVRLMRGNREECEHLMARIVRFLRSLIDHLTASKVPIVDGTPTAARLFALRSNLMAIKDDTIRWSRLNIWDSLTKRDRIKVAISRHGENLTDCFNTFQVLSMMTVANFVDRANANMLPIASPASTAPQGDGEGPKEAFRDTVYSVPSTNLHDFLQRPAGQAVFEQIGVAVQGRLGEIGLQSISTPPSFRSPAVTLLHTGHDRDVWYLTSQISELRTEVGSILPDIAVDTATETEFVEWKTHYPQTGAPTRQLRKTVAATLELLNELQSTPGVKLDVTSLADKMAKLSLNLSDLGLREEAFAVQTIVVVLCRAGRDMPAIARSLTRRSVTLSRLDRREEALLMSEEAANILRTLATTQPDAFRPDLASSLSNLSNCLSILGRREEALQMIKEAVIIHRTLAEGRPDAFRPDLAKSLNNLSNHLSGLDRWEEALLTIEDAVSIRRILAADRPEVFRPNLAKSLTNLSGCLSNLGRGEEALRAVEEAVKIYRPLAAEHPAVFDPDLARSLTNLSGILSHLGRIPEALSATEEAAKLLRLLVKEHPAIFTRKLAKSLSMLSRYYLDTGRPEDAVLAQKEAKDLDSGSA